MKIVDKARATSTVAATAALALAVGCSASPDARSEETGESRDALTFHQGSWSPPVILVPPPPPVVTRGSTIGSRLTCTRSAPMCAVTYDEEYFPQRAAFTALGCGPTGTFQGNKAESCTSPSLFLDCPATDEHANMFNAEGKGERKLLGTRLDIEACASECLPRPFLGRIYVVYDPLLFCPSTGGSLGEPVPHLPPADCQGGCMGPRL